jgi:release factor glutamine methyltransferase
VIASLGGVEEAALTARLRAAGCVFAEDEAALLLGEGADAAALEAMVARRVAGEPLEHVLGWAAFRGRRVAVAAGVFVPRQRSGLLVDRAVALTRPGAVVVDLCCGSGALGAAVAAEAVAAEAVAAEAGGIEAGCVELHAADVDAAAVACARRTVPAGAQVHLGDLDAALPADLRGRVDVLLASPPYVPTAGIASMPPEAREHEPHVALDGGDDGLGVLRRIAAVAPGWLAPGGAVLLECAAHQADAAREAVAAAGLSATVEHDDETDGTVVVGRREGA